MQNVIKPNLFKYLCLFSIVYLVVLMTISFAMNLLEIKEIPGLTTTIIMICAAYTAKLFVDNEGRAPHKKEQKILSAGGLVSSYIVSILLTIIYSIFLGMDLGVYVSLFIEMPLLLALPILLFISACYYLAFYIVFGKVAQNMADKIK
ncbi:ABZJ_00895 family protein [Pseudemcibacter aquimaris]|uniref:ABZJ_00895 family protein n=1 Tax=Pseudemcibacter aquimaris TaxID=2857064 RepID=UPI0020114C2D|nr:ABZJ_00895 family protein [Pseudemcibacter aquimaris]MCC3860944.1 ABZJ_00895 family protein [Pseudemcibacter aquimaris]WDU59763.1 ABZJ_00895 family protein [Pseudemcibacter aquimaris]